MCLFQHTAGIRVESMGSGGTSQGRAPGSPIGVTRLGSSRTEPEKVGLGWHPQEGPVTPSEEVRLEP